MVEIFKPVPDFHVHEPLIVQYIMFTLNQNHADTLKH